MGSPPQVRGKASSFRFFTAVWRITPAGAGKSTAVYQDELLAMDHPRRCGEKFDELHHCIYLSGSPPQVRGKGTRRSSTNCPGRITPAGAGKRCWEHTSHQEIADHPRRCGEKSHRTGRGVRKLGSPPQVRGKEDAPKVLFADAGITPAGAGKSPTSCPMVSRAGDHPRRCGEKTTRGRISLCLAGSPPQVRGKERSVIREEIAARITPAGAGKRCFQFHFAVE